MKIAIKTLDRQRFELDVDKSTTVPDLKKLLSEKTGTDVAEIRVIFRGKARHATLTNEHEI